MVRLLIWQAKFRQVLGNYDFAEQLLYQAQAHLNDLACSAHDTRTEQAVILHRLGQVATERGAPQMRIRCVNEPTAKARGLYPWHYYPAG